MVTFQTHFGGDTGLLHLPDNGGRMPTISLKGVRHATEEAFAFRS